MEWKTCSFKENALNIFSFIAYCKLGILLKSQFCKKQNWKWIKNIAFIVTVISIVTIMTLDI